MGDPTPNPKAEAWLAGLVRAVEEERARDAENEAWEAYTRGGPAPEAGDAELLELFRPLDPKTAARMRSRALGAYGVTWIGSARRWIAPVLAIAASIPVALLARTVIAPSSLPGYTLAVAGGGADSRAERGGAPTAAELRSDREATLSILLRPKVAPGGAISALILAPHMDRLVEVDASIEMDEGGSIRVVGKVADLLPHDAIERGLVIVVGRPLSLWWSRREIEAAARTSDEAVGAGWQLRRWRPEGGTQR